MQKLVQIHPAGVFLSLSIPLSLNRNERRGKGEREREKTENRDCTKGCDKGSGGSPAGLPSPAARLSSLSS